MPDLFKEKILDRVLRGISLNRNPGYHFPGHFLDIRVEGERSYLEQGPHCTDGNGEIDIAFCCLFLDTAMGRIVREALSHHGPLPTLSISLRLTGLPRRGDLHAHSDFLGLIESAARPQAMARTVIENSEGIVGYAGANFVVGKQEASAPKVDAAIPILHRNELNSTEIDIVARAEAAIDRRDRRGGTFADHFLEATESVDGFRSLMRVENGPHVTNRMGYLQGGIQIGLAAKNADVLLGAGWMLNEANVAYLRPGGGPWFDVSTDIVHKGGTTATLVTQIVDHNHQAIFHATTMHCLRRPLST